MNIGKLYRHLPFIYIVFLSACQYLPQTESENQIVSNRIGYFDSLVFDKQLSEALKANNDEVVTTNFISSINVNQIPPRLDKWLTYVNDNDGQVTVVPEGSVEKGIFSEVVGLAFGAYNYGKEVLTYRPAEKYNATLYYDAISGDISRVIFEPRQ